MEGIFEYEKNQIVKKNDKVDHKKFTILSRRKKIHKIKTQTALWEKKLHHMVCDKQWFLSKQ